ncbi:hypothetical protein [Paracerasibacillus soli]|uniref:hypothetical protein n=1 Tax=Paracerasibacillus soli TaxID=480284 RepID=UPI00387E1D6B
MKGSTEKRLFQYALKFKRGIMIGIICLMIATTLELAGPLIAKKVIDEHIVGIEGIWQEVPEEIDRYTVSYQGSFYKRADRVKEDEEKLGTATLLQVGKSYYFVNDDVPLKGKRSVQNGMISIVTSDTRATFQAVKMDLKELYPFFQQNNAQFSYY